MCMRPGGLVCSLLSTILVTSISIINTTVYCQENEEIEKVIVALDSLPEQFSNDKLPNLRQRTSKCLEHLGCIQQLPDLVSPQEPNIMKTEFQIYTANYNQTVAYKPIEICLTNSELCAIYPYNLSSLLNSKYDPNLRTIILIGGYRSAPAEKWQVGTWNTWSKLENINLVLVSWTGGNKGLYRFAAANTKIISRQITVLLYYLAKLNDLELADDSFSEKIYLIGHSLGAHISGFVGQDFGGKVGRITGLDTAGPKFAGVNGTYRLDRTDAQLVDAIHTNGGNLTLGPIYYGMEMPVGHLDYYANDGKRQPNCKFDLFGCSHKTAPDLFLSFLKHELHMREHFDRLKRGYHDYHRVFGYRSDDYESFNNGSSLSKLCPITTLDEKDLYSEDVKQCSVPIDFLSWFDKLRSELERKYQISFDPESKKSNKFYFYTSADEPPNLNHHNLVRIRVTKSANLNTSATEGCDIMLDMKMANGIGSKHEIKNYNLMDQGDHYEVIVPYLSPTTASTYALTTLDANDFFTGNIDNLLTNVAKVFPTSIVINGLVVGSLRPKNKGFLETLRNFFNIAEGKIDEGKSKIHQCSLNIESVTVTPMKKLHRHFVAEYSARANKKMKPDVLFLFNANSTMPKIEILPEKKDKLYTDDNQMVSEIFIDTVIVGPLDDSEDSKMQDNEEDAEQNSEEIDHTHNTETSSVSASTWLSLTIATMVSTLLIVSILWCKFLPSKRDVDVVKRALIVDG